jgi:hypothetical protein
MTEAEALSAIRSSDPALVARAEATLWQIWCRSGDRAVDRLLQQGIDAMERRELDEARALFGQHREAAALFRRALDVHPHLTSAPHNLVAAMSEVVKGNGH